MDICFDSNHALGNDKLIRALLTFLKIKNVVNTREAILCFICPLCYSFIKGKPVCLVPVVTLLSMK